MHALALHYSLAVIRYLILSPALICLAASPDLVRGMGFIVVQPMLENAIEKITIRAVSLLKTGFIQISFRRIGCIENERMMIGSEILQGTNTTA